MAKFNKGYSNIKVNLISWAGDDIARQCYEFGVYGSDAYETPQRHYDCNADDCKNFVKELVKGLTFPKYAFLGTRFNFSIEGISRICLAQLTRDNGYFCSESHGVRPLTQEFNIPLNMANDASIMSKVTKAQELLEEAYIEACEKGVPGPESRYICLHSQTISLTASFTPSDFARACYSRTNNSFCDELNYVYRKMFYELTTAIDRLKDENSKTIWKWLINEKKCIDDNYYRRTNVFNGDFAPSLAKEYVVEKPAVNDWRKSCWKLELERMLSEEPYLLTEKECKEIMSWMTDEVQGKTLYTTFDENLPRAFNNAIKTMPYYNKEDKNGI